MTSKVGRVNWGREEDIWKEPIREIFQKRPGRQVFEIWG